MMTMISYIWLSLWNNFGNTLVKWNIRVLRRSVITRLSLSEGAEHLSSPLAPLYPCSAEQPEP